MPPIRPSPTPGSPPRALTRRWVWPAGLIAVAAVAVAVAGWLFVGNPDKSGDRAAALAAGRDLHPDAGRLLTAYLARDENDVQVRETLVVWLLLNGVPFAQVEPHLDRLCELAPGDPTPWRTRAVERIRAGRTAEGMADAERTLELEPGDTDTLALLARTAIDSGDPTTAVRALRRRIDSATAPPDELTSLLIRAQLQQGDTRAAELALGTHYPPARTDAQAELLRGLVDQAAGRHADAVPHLRTAGRSAGQRHVALAALTKSLVALGREEEAARVLEQLDAAQGRVRVIEDARQRPGDLAAQVRAAEAHLADGQPGEAARLLEAATSAHGRSPEAIALLARAYRQLGREDLARRCEQGGR